MGHLVALLKVSDEPTNGTILAFHWDLKGVYAHLSHPHEIQTVPLPQKVSLTTASSCGHYVSSQQSSLVGVGGGKHPFLARCTPGVAVESPLRRIL